MLEQKWINELDLIYRDSVVFDILKEKIDLFKANWEEGAQIELFSELIYCLLTAQTKFHFALKVQRELLYDENFSFKIFNLSDRDFFDYICPILRKNFIRFYNNKTKNIVFARRLFVDGGQIKIKKFLDLCEDVFEKRKWLVDNVAGFSFKEAGHFMRNVGLGSRLAILDRHVLRTLKLIGLIEDVSLSLSPSKYLQIEKTLADFSDFVGIPMDYLDFLLFVIGKKYVEKSQTDVLGVLRDLK